MSRTPTADRAIIFLHIPKTAGTTLTHVIRRHFKPDACYTGALSSARGLETFTQLPPARKAAIRMLWGHIPFGVHRQLPQPATYFTFLRHPVERVLSHYYFQMSRPDLFWLPEEITRDKLSLHDVIERGLIVDITNMQTRKLAGLPHLFPRGSYTAEHLALAKKNLRECFSVVGLVHRFDESLLLLKKAYGWRHIYYLPYNVTRKRPRRDSVPPETIALIEREEMLDMALYEYGKQLFAEQLAHQDENFPRELRRFRFLNRNVFGPLLKAQRRLEDRRSFQLARHGASRLARRFQGEA